MNIICLGGAGRICRETALDLVRFGGFERVTIADIDENEGKAVADSIGADFRKIDIFNREQAVSLLSEYEIVVDGTTISQNALTSSLIAEAGCHGVNLNGFGEEYAFSDIFKEKGKTFVPGFGMTPGVTQMMAMHAAEKLDTVDTVRVSHGAFRPIAFSKSITETTTYEYDPALETRVVFEDGEFIQVPPFARPREIILPLPYGKTVQYIIPHAETVTLADALKSKGVRLIETRGTWPRQNMALISAMYDYGMMRNDKITVNGVETGIMDCIGQYLQTCKEGITTELYGYALHVEVTGVKSGKKMMHTLYHTHPASDGTFPEWAGLRAYTRNVGIPMSIAAILIKEGKAMNTGAVIPEDAFRPQDVFEAMKLREMHIHELTAEI